MKETTGQVAVPDGVEMTKKVRAFMKKPVVVAKTGSKTNLARKKSDLSEMNSLRTILMYILQTTIS